MGPGTSGGCPHFIESEMGNGCSSEELKENHNADANSPSSYRVASSIKKTGTEHTWMYPSVDMFKAAMLRKSTKNKNEPSHSLGEKEIMDLDQDTLSSIVHMHNIVNEQAWQHILKFERLHNCYSPSLTSFQGKPKDKTFKAMLWQLLGHSPPFDRHDWYVDRCGCSKEPIRYIIDFYAGQKKLALSTQAEVEIPTFYLDVRPAPTLGGIIDRLRLFAHDLFTN